MIISKKVYRVNFEGYSYIEADSKEEAEEKFNNSDTFQDEYEITSIEEDD